MTWGTIALSVPAVLMAAVLTFVWGYCVAMVAFWTTKNGAINRVYWSIAMFLGGRIAPLAVLPPVIQATARSRAGNRRRSSSSPGASVLKSPITT